MGCGGSRKGVYDKAAEADDSAAAGSMLQSTSSTSVVQMGQHRPAAVTDTVMNERLSPRRMETAAPNDASISPRQGNDTERDKLEAMLVEHAHAQATLQKQLQDSKAECQHLRLSSRDLQKSHKDLVTRLQNPGESLSVRDNFEKSEREKRQVSPGATLRGESMSLADEFDKSQRQHSQEIEELRGKLRNVECTSAESTQKCELLQKRASELEEILNEAYLNPDSPRRPGDSNICSKERQLMEQSQIVGYGVPRRNLQDADSICFQACDTFESLNFDNLKLCARAVVFV